MGSESRTTVRSVVKSLSDAVLAVCVRESTEWERSGVLAGGCLAALAADLVQKTGIDQMSSLEVTETAVLREAANRFSSKH